MSSHPVRPMWTLLCPYVIKVSAPDGRMLHTSPVTGRVARYVTRGAAEMAAESLRIRYAQYGSAWRVRVMYRRSLRPMPIWKGAKK